MPLKRTKNNLPGHPKKGGRLTRERLKKEQVPGRGLTERGK